MLALTLLHEYASDEVVFSRLLSLKTHLFLIQFFESKSTSLANREIISHIFTEWVNVRFRSPFFLAAFSPRNPLFPRDLAHLRRFAVLQSVLRVLPPPASPPFNSPHASGHQLRRGFRSSSRLCRDPGRLASPVLASRLSVSPQHADLSPAHDSSRPSIRHGAVHRGSHSKRQLVLLHRQSGRADDHAILEWTADLRKRFRWLLELYEHPGGARRRKHDARELNAVVLVRPPGNSRSEPAHGGRNPATIDLLDRMLALSRSIELLLERQAADQSPHHLSFDHDRHLPPREAPRNAHSTDAPRR